MSTDIRD